MIAKRMGRPPKYPDGTKTAKFSCRIRGNLGDLLSDAAAKNGRSVSEEAEYRLLQSFENDRVRQIVREEMAEAGSWKSYVAKTITIRGPGGEVKIGSDGIVSERVL